MCTLISAAKTGFPSGPITVNSAEHGPASPLVIYEPDCAPEGEGEAVGAGEGAGETDSPCPDPNGANATVANKKKNNERQVVFMCNTGLKIIQIIRVDAVYW